MFDSKSGIVQKLHPYDLSAAACCSAACLQTAVSVALVAGFSASCFQVLRHSATAFLYCARCASGTLLETHASYLAMKSSHSGMPIFCPLDEAVLDPGLLAAEPGFAEPALELLSFVVSVLLHPIKRATHRTKKINRVLRIIGVLLQS